MPTFEELTRKLIRVVCCETADVDQNEGPPPSLTTAPRVAITAAEQPEQQLQQESTADTSADFTQEVQSEPVEEDWDDEEPEPSPFKADDFVVKQDEYSKYNYDNSAYKSFDDVQKAFEALSRDYKMNDTVDWDSVWGNRAYERSIRNWDPEQEFNTTSTRAQAAAR